MSSGDLPKPPADFVIRLVGSDVKPWRVPLRVLGRVLTAVQRLVDQRDDLVDLEEEELKAVPEPEARTLQLLGVRSASAGYAVSAASRTQTLSILHDAGKGLAKPDGVSWQPSAISSIQDLSQIARQLGCIIEFRSPLKGSGLGEVIATIGPETGTEILRQAFSHGYTSVYGQLERVGGATARRCGIHVQNRSRMLFCDIQTEGLVRELGKFIYTDVVLSGEAVWYRSNGQMKSLAVSSFSPAKTGSFTDVARQIGGSGGNAWDKIADPEAYLREMRG